MSNFAKQIAAFEAKRAANAARMAEIMEKSGEEGATLDAAQQEEFDGLQADNLAIDGHLNRLKAVAAADKAAAKPVGDAKGGDAASQARSVSAIVKAPTLAPGVAFARLARVKGLARLDGASVREVAKDLYGEDSSVYRLVTKAAVAAGSSAASNWAEDLVGDETSVYADFVEFLRPQTILGRFGMNGIPSLRMIPFRTPLIGQTGGGDAYWVGEGKPKPLTAFDFSRTTLDELKVANIAVVTEELLRKSSPSADMIVRDALVAALKARLDTDFISPAKSASAGVSPASITNGVSAITSSGNDADAVREDIRQLFNAFIAANNAPTAGVWIMAARTALALSLMQNPLGQAEFPGISMTGGTLFGLPVIVSEYVPSVSAGSYVVLANASDIYFADEGGVSVDISREASLEMKDASLTQNAGDGTGVAMVSMFQTNSVAFRAERILNWAKRRASAVQVLDEVNWGVPGS